MARSRRHPREVRERAVGLVLEHQSEYASQWEVSCGRSGTWSEASAVEPDAHTIR